MKNNYKWLKDFCKEKRFSTDGTKSLLALAKLRDEPVDWLKMDEYKAKEYLLIDLLMKQGVYPKNPTPVMKEHGYSAFDMYEGWGVLWAFYTEPLACPHCKADLRKTESGPPFKREIGIYDTAKDRTSHFICPDCKGKIERI